MQTCSKCNASSPDNALTCVNCHSDLSLFSATAVALKQMQANPRVRAVRISVAGDACSYCYERTNTYPKDQVPHLPMKVAPMKMAAAVFTSRCSMILP